MQKTLLRRLALKSIAEIGISQWIWEIKSNFEKIRRLRGSGIGKIESSLLKQ